MQITLLNNISLTCNEPPFQSGGFGEIYHVIGENQVAKLYIEPQKIDFSGIEKLIHMREEVMRNPILNRSLCWPLDIVITPRLGVMLPKIPEEMIPVTGYTSLITLRSLEKKKKGNWKDRISIGEILCDLVDELHKLDLIIADIGPKNLFTNMSEGELIMIDCDGIVPPGPFSPQAIGSPNYIAPEVYKTKVPSQKGDLHALAVTLYELLFLCHPLIGPKKYSDDPEINDKLMFGEKALFIEHPEDQSNKPVRMPIQAKDFGKDIWELCKKAFIDGLFVPSDRPSAKEWKAALSNLKANLKKCSNESCFGKYSPQSMLHSNCYWCGQNFDTSHVIQKEIVREVPLVQERINLEFLPIEEVSRTEQRTKEEHNLFVAKMKSLISADKLKEALDQISAYTSVNTEKGIHYSLILLNQRYTRIRELERNNVLNWDAIKLELSQISKSLLDVLEELN